MLNAAFGTTGNIMQRSTMRSRCSALMDAPCAKLLRKIQVFITQMQPLGTADKRGGCAHAVGVNHLNAQGWRNNSTQAIAARTSFSRNLRTPNDVRASPRQGIA